MASAFEIYLRTGRRVGGEVIPVETKFNPWHDPEDGRFTFAGQGRYFPGRTVTRQRTSNGDFSGGGGSFGGAGSGIRDPWVPDHRSNGGAGTARALRSRNRQKPVGDVASNRQESLPVGQETRLVVRRNGYEFEIDAHVRPRRVAGELRLQSQPRSRRAQTNAGKPDRRITDDGGHFIAARFNGPREWFNHFAQDANFNRGAYRALEDRWAKTIHSGKRVFVDILPNYRGTSMRPHMLTIIWTVDGKKLKLEFSNEKGGKRRDGR